MNSKIENNLRAFAMSGFQITEELKLVECEFDVELSHVKRERINSEVDKYPQFERSIRAEASRMAQHYSLFYCLEKSVRQLITDILHDAEGVSWWDSQLIPDDIKKAVIQRQNKEIDNGITERSEFSIDYTTFGELSKIINSNWELFGTVFKSQKAVEKIMASLNLLRGPIAHCCPLSEHEINRLNLTVEDFFKARA